MQTMLLPNLTQEEIDIRSKQSLGELLDTGFFDKPGYEYTVIPPSDISRSAIAVDGNPKNPIQSQIQFKPGYSLDPLFPLWTGNEPEEGLGQVIYQMAYTVDRFGNEVDWIEDLEDRIEVLQTGIFGWYNVAINAWKIKLHKAWKGKFKSFRDFCEKALGVTAASIDAKIRAARVVSALVSLGFDRLPLSPSVALELSKVDENCVSDSWQQIIDRFQDHEITLERVKNMLADPFGKVPELKQIRIPIAQWERLKELARQGNTSPTRLLQGIINHYIGEPPNDDGISTGAEDPETSAIAGLESGIEKGSDLPQDPLPDETDPAVHDGDSHVETPTEPQDLPQHPEQSSNPVLVSPSRSPSPPPMFAIGQILPNFWRSP